MEKLSAKKRLAVVRQYLSGLSYDEIAAKTGTSKGTVANVVTELKAGVFPEAAGVAEHVDELRELSLDLKKFKLTPTQCAVGIALLARLNECGLDPSDMDRWPWILKSLKTEDQAQEFVGLIYSIREVQQGTGLSFPALEKKAHELEKKAHELEPVSAKVDEGRKQLAELKKQQEDLTSALAVLGEKMKWLVPRVQELEQRENSLLDRHKSMLAEEEKAKQTLSTLKAELNKLEKTGLSVKALVDFNKKLEIVAKHHGIKASMVRERLLGELKLLDKGLGLETRVKKQEQILKETNQSFGKRKGELTSCETALKNLQQQKLNLEASIKETRECVSKEIAQMVPIAQDTMKQIAKNLKSGCAETLSVVHQLREESIKVGQEVGQYEGILQQSRWVVKLMALLDGGEKVGASEVRTIALSVNSGICTWLAQQDGKLPQVELLALNLSKLVKELEGWRPQG